MFDNIQRGTYLIGDKEMYFRSKWEANYALYLEWLKKQGEIQDWEYEPMWYEFPIKHGATRYLPDFAVTLKNGSELHEVKGRLTGRAKTQLKRMAKFYPHIKLIVIDQVFMKDLTKKMGKVLKFY